MAVIVITHSVPSVALQTSLYSGAASCHVNHIVVLTAVLHKGDVEKGPRASSTLAERFSLVLHQL